MMLYLKRETGGPFVNDLIIIKLETGYDEKISGGRTIQSMLQIWHIKHESTWKFIRASILFLI